MKSSARRREPAVFLIAACGLAIAMTFTACGGGFIAPANGSQQDAALTITSVVPDTSPLTGGKTVTINGANFTSGAQSATLSVTFGGVSAAHVTVVSDTQVRAVTPPHKAGTVSVEVTNSDGKSATVGNAFTYTPASPTMSRVSPGSGPGTGGTAVTIIGTNFARGATVSFGGTAASNVSFVSSTQLKAVTPAHRAGKVDVTVTNPDGTDAVLASAFAYVSSSPTISGVSPSSGPTTGGTAVTVDGTNFASGATVSFGGAAASGVSFVSSTQLKATTPAHAAGAVSVTVTNPAGGSATSASAFTYTTSTSPTVSSVSPNSGPVGGGTAVTITGTNFASGATISFGGIPASNVSFVSSTQLKATTPAHAAGAVNVAVTNPNGSSAALSNGFTYGSSTPTVSSVSPISGPAAGGTTIAITGTNFQSGASVSIGGVAATSIKVTNSTTIQAMTPAHSYGKVSVTVTNSGGQSATLSSGFTYHSVTLTWDPPTSTSVSITGYNVYRSQAAAGPFAKINGSSAVTGTSYTDTTVQGGTTYYYEVTSVDSNGTESSPNGPIQVTTGP
ncbi:MAG: IPT/TIG domain-containing protein [Acidobacteria bacterium]|nr:IPT/TIG domain-containing protein [Acidobacteriota bacterium]